MSGAWPDSEAVDGGCGQRWGAGSPPSPAAPVEPCGGADVGAAGSVGPLPADSEPPDVDPGLPGAPGLPDEPEEDGTVGGWGMDVAVSLGVAQPASARAPARDSATHVD